MLKSFLTRLFLLQRTLRNFCILRFSLVIALPFDQAMLGLDLSDIQAGYLQPGMRQHLILNLLTGGIVQDARHIHILQGKFHPDALAGYLTLGKSKYRFNPYCQ